MEKLPKILYVGNDVSMLENLQSHVSPLVPCRLESLREPSRIIQRLETLESESDNAMVAQSFATRFAATILDVDLPAEKAAEILRRIKSHDGGIPVIMLCGRPTLTSVSLARLDGAEAFFAKPLERLDPLVDALRHAIDKLSHWRDCLQLAAQSSLNPTP